MVTICPRVEVSSLWVPTPAGLTASHSPQVPKGNTTRTAGGHGNQDKDHMMPTSSTALGTHSGLFIDAATDK